MEPLAVEERIPYVPLFMEEAFVEAERGLQLGEVAVGCVFVDARTNRIVSRGHNLTNARKNALEHAEIIAIEACCHTESGSSNSAASDEEVKDDDLLLPLLHHIVCYVTVEPCIMCASALLFEGVRHVFFGCANPRFGGNGSVLSIHRNGVLLRGPLMYRSEGGYEAERAVSLLTSFYSQENALAPDHKRRPKKDES